MAFNNGIIDFRSDTVTKPSDGMRKAMYEAEVGDDVFSDDSSVNRLEEMIAGITGLEKALFVSSGTQSNLLALMSHCERGDEYIAGQTAHCYNHEGGGAASLGSIQPQPVDFEADGTIDLDKAAALIKPDDFHFARTKLLCLENTQDGKVLPMDYLEKTFDFATEKRLPLHLDGARVFNAAVSLGTDVKNICSGFDTVSVCLSKGLGAPVGSVLCGQSDLIAKARRWRKVLGGGMRQAGIIAAGGIYALENNIERLSDDHTNAALLKDMLAEIDQIEITSAATNMIFCRFKNNDSAELAEYLNKEGIIILPGDIVRFVCHINISEDDVVKLAGSIRKYYN